MKKMKKTISLILAVIMLLSGVPMQSFALFDLFKPKVVKVEMLDNYPISNQYVQNNQYYGECDFYGCEGFGPLDYKVYFSNGKTEVIGYDGYEGSKVFSSIEFVYVCTVAYAEKCAEAIATGKDTVEVDVVVCIYYSDDNFDSFTFTMEKPIVDKIIADVRLVGNVPTMYDTDWPISDFIGKKFEVEYADGKTETHTLKTAKEGYVLGDEYVNIWFGEDKYIDSVTGETVYYKGLDIVYVDCIAPIEREYLPCEYESLDITDFKLNGKGDITEVTYKLTYKDGRVIEKTCALDRTDYNYYTAIDMVDGFEIYFGFDCYDSYYCIDAKMGYNIWEINYYAEYENMEDFCDCRCHKDGLLNQILNAFLCKIWYFFGINEYCQCGYWHW